MTIVMHHMLTQVTRHQLPMMQSVTMVTIAGQGRPIAIGRAVVTQSVGHPTEAGVARDLVYGVTIVTGVVNRHRGAT